MYEYKFILAPPNNPEETEKRINMWSQKGYDVWTTVPYAGTVGFLMAKVVNVMLPTEKNDV